MKFIRANDWWRLAISIGAICVSTLAFAEFSEPDCESGFLEDRIHALRFSSTLLGMDIEGERAVHFLVSNLDQDIMIGRDYLVQNEPGIISIFGARSHEKVSIDEIIEACEYQTHCSDEARAFLDTAVRARKARSLHQE